MTGVVPFRGKPSSGRKDRRSLNISYASAEDAGIVSFPDRDLVPNLDRDPHYGGGGNIRENILLLIHFL
jgi:hypothetical protein